VIRLAAGCLIVAAVILLIGTNATAASGHVTAKHITLVALGDSLPYGRADCGFCQTFVDRFRTAIARHAHVQVTERNLSEHTGINSRNLRSELHGSKSLRAAVAKANVITLTIGHNDPPWNRDDDPCDGNRANTTPQWKKFDSRCLDATASVYRRNLAEILNTIKALRSGKPTMLRVTDDYNDIIGDPTVPKYAYRIVKPFFDRYSALTCQLARQHGAVCIDTYHAFNGPNGVRDAGPLLAPDHTHPNAKGHKLIAQLLVRAGYRPLFP